MCNLPYLWGKQPYQSGHKVGEKLPLSFEAFSRAIIILFKRLSQQNYKYRLSSIKFSNYITYDISQQNFTQ